MVDNAFITLKFRFVFAQRVKTMKILPISFFFFLKFRLSDDEECTGASAVVGVSSVAIATSAVLLFLRN